MILYAVFEYHNDDETMNNPFLVGIFATEQRAEIAADTLQEEKGEEYTYFCLDYEVDQIYLKDEEGTMIDAIESELEDMIRQGKVDYKIGEDGEFYFEATDNE